MNYLKGHCNESFAIRTFADRSDSEIAQMQKAMKWILIIAVHKQLYQHFQPIHDMNFHNDTVWYKFIVIFENNCF